MKSAALRSPRRWRPRQLLLVLVLCGSAAAEIDPTTDPNYTFRHLKVLGPVHKVTYKTVWNFSQDSGTSSETYTFNPSGQVTRIDGQGGNYLEFQYRDGCFVKQQNWGASDGLVVSGASFVHLVGPRCQVQKETIYDDDGQVSYVVRYQYSGTRITKNQVFPDGTKGVTSTTTTVCQGLTCTTTASVSHTEMGRQFNTAEKEVLIFSRPGIRKSRVFTSETRVAGQAGIYESGEDRVAYNAQGWPVTHTEKSYSKKFNMSGSSQERFTYIGKDRYGNWLTRKELRITDNKTTPGETITRTFTYR
ncbi:hypothetical protein [Deinococcus enclensis]|uniref:YD repeat-containing protein n=1 Tax=Deinococcus enclensis TaxID=1049582 RepID=A0ABT9MG39_9DEIO|nr:hypothetical protein [Deinococcus enclensis]MDP9765548.1 hypothetical protein [Deinococcus enclensis]